MHVATTRRQHKDKVYETHLLRHSYREGGKVKNETLANLSYLPAPTIQLVRESLAGKTHVIAGEGLSCTASLPHGHVALVVQMAKKLGLPDLLGPPSRQRDIAFGLIVSRVINPRPKLATTKWWRDTTLAVDLGIESATTDEVYGAMDWLGEQQETTQSKLVSRHLKASGNSPTLAYFDLSSSWVEGSHNELAQRGYSRDHKGGKAQIEYGLLTDCDGRPLSIEVFPGNTGDPTAFVSIVDKIRSRYSIDYLTMVGDRGMITSARISALREMGTIGWLTCLRAPQIAKLASQDGPLQLSLFDEVDLAEFSHLDYPGERLVACRNPLLAHERGRKRQELLAASEKVLAPIIQAVDQGRLIGADKIGLRVGKVINKYKMAKHFNVTITDSQLTITRRESQIQAEAALDGIYVLRTTLRAKEVDSSGVVHAYKALSNVERDFRHIKVDDIDLRPIHHYLGKRVRSHVFICMLAAYLVWHLRHELAPLTFTDETPLAQDNPVAPAVRSVGARRKTAKKINSQGEEVRGFRELLSHLGTMTRNTMVTTSDKSTVSFDLVSVPTPIQRRAFELIDSPVPLRLM